MLEVLASRECVEGLLNIDVGREQRAEEIFVAKKDDLTEQWRKLDN
jgi:hypothetical protein